MSDADSEPRGALRVRWSANPALPGPVAVDVEVATARFSVLRLQVLGDGSSGEPTLARRLRLAWEGNAPNPPPTVFPRAPTGLYSQVALQLDGQQGAAYEITGTARVAGAMEPFRVTDTFELAVAIPGFDVAFEPGRDAALPVVLDLSTALTRINFVQLPVEQGVRVLGPADPQIVELRERLADAFVPAP